MLRNPTYRLLALVTIVAGLVAIANCVLIHDTIARDPVRVTHYTHSGCGDRPAETIPFSSGIEEDTHVITPDQPAPAPYRGVNVP